MSASLLPVVLHLDCEPALASKLTDQKNSFEISAPEGGAARVFSVDRVLTASETSAGSALTQAFLSIPRYASLLVVLLGESGGDTAIAELFSSLEKMVSEPSGLVAQFLANDGTGTLSETLLYEDCVALSREFEAGTQLNARNSVASRFRGIQLVNLAADDRTAVILVCSKLSAPILAALGCSPRKELWVLARPDSDPRRLSSLFSEVPGISELIAQMAPPPAPTMEQFLPTVAANPRELRRLQELQRRASVALRNAASDEALTSVDALQEEIALLHKENEELYRVVAHRDTAISEHTSALSKLETELTASRRRCETAERLCSEQAESLEQLRSRAQQPQECAALQESHTAGGATSSIPTPAPTNTNAEVLLQEVKARNDVLREDLLKATQSLHLSARHCDEYKARTDDLERQLLESKSGAVMMAGRVASNAAEIEKLSTAAAIHQRENLMLVHEFQQKEKRWQLELLEASDALNKALANYHQARTVVEMQARTLDAAAASALATSQMQVEELDHLVAQVRALSPERRFSRPHRITGHDGLLLSPTPVTVEDHVEHSRSGVSYLRRASPAGDAMHAPHATPFGASRVLSGRERILDI